MGGRDRYFLGRIIFQATIMSVSGVETQNEPCHQMLPHSDCHFKDRGLLF